MPLSGDMVTFPIEPSGHCTYNVRTLYVHCTNRTYNVRTLYVQCPLGSDQADLPRISLLTNFSANILKKKDGLVVEDLAMNFLIIHFMIQVLTHLNGHTIICLIIYVT